MDNHARLWVQVRSFRVPRGCPTPGHSRLRRRRRLAVAAFRRLVLRFLLQSDGLNFIGVTAELRNDLLLGAEGEKGEKGSVRLLSQETRSDPSWIVLRFAGA